MKTVTATPAMLAAAAWISTNLPDRYHESPATFLGHRGTILPPPSTGRILTTGNRAARRKAKLAKAARKRNRR